MQISLFNNKKLKLIEQFRSSQREKVLAYMQGKFSISSEDGEDIFQEAFITLYNNILEGKLEKLTSSLSTYFIGICNNKAREFLREKNKVVNLSYDPGIKEQNAFLDDKVESILTLESDNDIARQKKEKIVRNIVRDLPSPCNELLWGFYRDGLSMKQLAEKFDYKSESSVKVTKHRCCEKFRVRFNKLVKPL